MLNEKQKKIIERIPEAMKNTFMKAFSGKSLSYGIKAKCLDCSCYQREEVKNCTVNGCPLYPYRVGADRSGIQAKNQRVLSKETILRMAEGLKKYRESKKLTKYEFL